MNPRSLLLATLSIAMATQCAAQSVMTVYQKDQAVGTAKYFFKKTSKGLETYFALTVRGNQGTVQFIARGEHDSKGNPLKESYRQFSSMGKSSKVLTFSKTSIQIDIEVDGRKERKKRPISKGVNLTTPSVFWFINKTPIVGKVEVTDEFDSDRYVFKPRTIQYVGTETLVLRGKRTVTHKVKHSDGTYWLDMKGLPVQIQLGELLMVRN
jgi:hypothetical protein